MKRKSKKILSDSLFPDETSTSETTNDTASSATPVRRGVSYRESNEETDLPKGWEINKLIEVAKLIKGVTYKKDEAIKESKKDFIGILRANNINKTIVLNDIVYVPKKRVNVEQIIKKGDILIAMSSGSKDLVGKAAQANKDYEYSFGTFCGVIRPSESINKKYLGFYFQTKKYRHYVSYISKGVNINNLKRTHIEDMIIPCPDILLQNKIVSKIEELFSELDNGIEELKKVKAQLKTYRQSVLNAAFTGKLTEEWRSLEENKELYEISEKKFIDKKKQELLRPLTSKYNSRNIEVEYRVLRDFILEAICKNVNEELINKVISDFPFDTYKSETDNFLKSFLLWQTKSDEYLLLKGYSSFVLSQQRKAWIKYADDGLEGRVYQNPYMGYTQIAAFQDWMQIEKLKKDGIDYFKRTYILEPARKDYENEINLQKSVPKNLPKGWRISNLGSIARKITYKVLPSENSDLSFIGMDCIEPHSLRTSILYDFKDFKSSGNYFIKGQILYGRMRPYLNKVYKAEFNGACSGEFIVLECEKGLKSDLLKYILHSKEFVSFANNKTSGDRPRISFKEISEYIINLPPVEEQQKIIEEIETRLSVCDKMEETIETALSKSESLRQSILKQAFEGNLV